MYLIFSLRCIGEINSYFKSLDDTQIGVVSQVNVHGLQTWGSGQWGQASWGSVNNGTDGQRIWCLPSEKNKKVVVTLQSSNHFSSPQLNAKPYFATRHK